MRASEVVVERYRPVSRRRRLLIALLAVATASTIVLTLVGPPGAAKTKRLPPPDAPACSASQTTGCVGSMSTVIVPAITPMVPAVSPPGSTPR